jgi:hypothetical protein
VEIVFWVAGKYGDFIGFLELFEADGTGVGNLVNYVYGTCCGRTVDFFEREFVHTLVPLSFRIL